MRWESEGEEREDVGVEMGVEGAGGGVDEVGEGGRRGHGKGGEW